MLCFDIETTGLDSKRCTVTVVCTEDFATGETRAMEFARYPERREEMSEALVNLFDSSESLCAFNGVRFDIPFLATFLGVSEQKQMQWMAKTSDILEQSRLRYKKTFSLNLLCETNNIPIKISDGKEAIRMAEEKRWQELRTYCAKDVSILCDIYRMRVIKHPRLEQRIDLADWARKHLYEEQPCFLHHARTQLVWSPSRCAAVKAVFRENCEKDAAEKVTALQNKYFDATLEAYVYEDNQISKAYVDYVSEDESRMQIEVE